MPNLRSSERDSIDAVSSNKFPLETGDLGFLRA